METGVPCYLLLLPFVIVAAVTDALWNKIYNWTTYPGIVVGFAGNASLGALTGSGGWEGAVAGLLHATWGFLGCGFILLCCFVFFPIGGGDVKLIAMIGAFLGIDHGIEVMLWTFVLGAVIALGALIWDVGAVELVRRAARRTVEVVRTGGQVPLSEEDRKPLQRELFLAISAFLAVGVVMWRRLG